MGHCLALESDENTFLDHIDDIRDDICGETSQTQPRRNNIMSNSHILEAKSVEPSLDMELNVA